MTTLLAPIARFRELALREGPASVETVAFNTRVDRHPALAAIARLRIQSQSDQRGVAVDSPMSLAASTIRSS